MDASLDPAKNEQDFRKAFKISLGAHIFVAAFLIFRAAFFPTEPIRIENAIRVDIVGLPEKQARLPDLEPVPEAKPVESKPIEPKPEPVETKPRLPDKPAPPPAVAKPRNVKAEQQSAIKRLEAINKLKQKMENEKRQEIAGAINKAAVKGNQISKGNSLTGVVKLDHQDYLDKLNAKVKSHWALPRWLQNANLRARVIIYINADGSISKKTFAARSGNQTFDDRVLDAIDKSMPLPPPPSSLSGLLQIEGVELGFPD